MKFSISEINQILGNINFNGAFKSKLLFSKVSIDSRTISPEDLFIALKGENFDGHDFLKNVVNTGVKAVVINQGKQDLVPKNFPYWLVPDTKAAFQKLALIKRRKLKIPVIAITGSVGKTTTKEMTLEVLKSYGKVKVSEKNNNNEIGVGLTIHSCEESDELLVLEMGMRGRGQIEILSKFSEPNIAVITNIGSSHIGILGSRDSIAKAKCEITQHLNPDGVVIIPYGEPLLDENLKNFWRGKVVKVKLEKNRKNIKLNSSNDNFILGIYDGPKNIIQIEEKYFEISFKGNHNALNFLYVYAISRELGIDFDKFNRFNFKSLEGRNNVIHTKKLLIMDESYNASPESVKACIKCLLDYPGRHFFIFGSMKELGNKSEQYHLEIFKLINNSDIQTCLFICENELEINIRKYSYKSEKILIVKRIDKIIHIINDITVKGDVLLIKGSRYWQLDKLIPHIN